jgi:voltage-gated potassium channel
VTAFIRQLYFGKQAYSRVFRFTLLAIDFATIVYFIAVTALPQLPIFRIIDYVIAGYIALDLTARLIAARRKREWFTEISTWTDAIVLVTLFIPAAAEDYLFLRILRIFRLLRSYHLVRDLRELYPFFQRNEQIINSIVNLVVFVFGVSALVYALQGKTNAAINNYLDALYFTLSTLTTTGFGDIVLEGTAGRMLAVVIMVFGVGLFLRLIQVIFRPRKVHYRCSDCGLRLHDPDAVHCKHCGRVIAIDSDGE